MSGRGLGHTGGTLDKLESIPGFRVNLSIDEFTRVLAEVGTSIVGQSDSLAPADKKLYALRDVTATVSSIPLIAASVMSKKLAEGGDALLLDVKCGHGAFMRSEPDARELARLMVSIGRQAGLRTEAVITDMDAPLGRAVGNAVEIIECVETLKGQGPADIHALVIELATRLLIVSGQYRDPDASPAVRDAISSGRALEKMRAHDRLAKGRHPGGGRLQPPAGRPRAPCRESGAEWIRHDDEGGPDRTGVQGTRRGAATD